ncbi:hypothetical protein A1O7_09485 [Cladophialophora yegresii CBS 114405]|uniref:Uncharacterized protein n=1 Tax=Cladophialophora yegresii CBS 114405 TaxID=1182544 RepID=W9VF89_9EURO|nr:uncharacterized protein A1O7_09485 [Cladophialophora yegresii CBS 114405]EXJ54148.1 hypothetical protein A1O7_09485 [Cladophialophora yegresii CBS 114405]
MHDIETDAEADLMVKFPFGPFSNGSLFMCHSLTTGHTTCIISATRAQILANRFLDVFTHSRSSSPYAFIPAALLLEHLRTANDNDRNDIDQCVCRIENRSGVSLHNFGSRTRAKIGEYALLQRELHMQDALIVMAEHCFSFHAKCAAFVVAEELSFADLLPARQVNNDRGPTGQQQADYVRASLALNASMSSWTLEQLRALEKRLKVQLRVIDSTISTTDALTMIRLARASRSDSNTMKAITVLTMVFLPATFVCSLFSMGFFDFAGATDAGLEGTHRRTMRVAGTFWIYFAVAVPLTILVLGICAAWLQWSARQEDDSGDKPGSVEAKGGR